MLNKYIPSFIQNTFKFFFKGNQLNQKMDMAKKLYESKDKEQALKLYREVLEKDQNCKAARYWSGEIANEIKEEKYNGQKPK